MLAYACTCICTTKGRIPLGPLLGKQNIQAKEIYCVPDVKHTVQCVNKQTVVLLLHLRTENKKLAYF